jgi:hypothetical protein
MERSSALRWFLVVCALLALVFLWAYNDVTEVRVDLLGDTLTGYVDGQELSSILVAGKPAGDLVGLYLHGALNAQEWDGWQVRDYWSGLVLDHDGFSGSRPRSWQSSPLPWRRTLLGGWGVPELAGQHHDFAVSLAPYFPDRDVRIEAQLVRGLDGGIFVLATPELDGYCFHLRPLRTDVFWSRFKGGEPQGPVHDSARRYVPRPEHALKAIIWRLLANFFAGLGYVGTALILTGLLAPFCYLLRRPGRMVWRWLEMLWALLHPETRLFARRMAVFLVIMVVFLVTRSIAVVVLEKIPHVQDSIATLFQARIFAAGHLTAPVPEPVRAFHFEMTVIFREHWFSKYTVGHSLTLVPFVLLGKSWLWGPLSAAAVVALVFVFARSLFGYATGLLAIFFLARSPFFLLMSSSHMAHTSTLFWLCLYQVLLLGLVRWPAQPRTIRPGWWLAAGAGLALGMAVICRPLTALAVGLPGGVVLLWWLVRHRGRTWPLLALLVLGVALPVGFQLYFNATVTGDPLVFGYEVYSSVDRLGFGEVGWLGGHSPRNGLNNIFLNLYELLQILYGGPFYLALAFALLALVLPGRSRWDVYLLAQWLLLVAGYFFWWYHGIAYGPRFWYESIGALALLSARGVVGTIHLLLAWGRSLPARWRAPEWLRPAAVTGALVLPLWLLLVPAEDYLRTKIATEYKGYNFTNAALLRQVREKNLQDALVFVQKDLFWSEYGAAFSQNSPFLDTSVVYCQEQDEKTNRLVRQRFAGRSNWLWDGSSLTPYRP